MGSAIHGIDIVREAENCFGVAVVVLQANLHGNAVALGFHVNRTVVQNLLAAIQVLNELSDAAVIFELRRLGFAGFRIACTFIRKRDQQAFIEESQLTQSLCECVVVVVGVPSEDALVWKEANFGPSLGLYGAGFLELVGRLAFRI